MGYVAGWMYIGVALVGLGGLAVPTLRVHPTWQLALGCAAALCGLLNVIDIPRWGGRPQWMHTVAMAAGLPLLAAGMWATGAADSYLLPLFLLAPIHWAFFLDSRRVVGALCCGLAIAICSPMIYEHQVTIADAANVSSTALTALFIAAAISSIRRRLRRAERRLRALTDLDPLTGLLNRRGFTKAMQDLLGAAAPGTRPLLVLLDLDHLKRLNDTHGHGVGDLALTALADRLLGAIPRGYVAARLGGDEFAVAGRTSVFAGAADIATGLGDAVRGAVPGFTNAQVTATIGWSVGAAHTADAAGEASAMFELADRRMLRVKRSRPDPLRASIVRHHYDADPVGALPGVALA